MIALERRQWRFNRALRLMRLYVGVALQGVEESYSTEKGPLAQLAQDDQDAHLH